MPMQFYGISIGSLVINHGFMENPSVSTSAQPQTQELLTMTTTLREMQGLTTACRSESMAFDRRMESALNRLQEVWWQRGRAWWKWRWICFDGECFQYISCISYICSLYVLYFWMDIRICHDMSIYMRCNCTFDIPVFKMTGVAVDKWLCRYQADKSTSRWMSG